MRSTDGVTRDREVAPPCQEGTQHKTPVADGFISQDKTGRTRRSAPELFSVAQSSGLWPGARTTFSRFLDLVPRVGGFVVVGGGINEDPEDGVGGPGVRGTGSGGGGISVDGVMRCVEAGVAAEEIR